MNFLITGGAGFIGSNLTDELLKDGHFIIAIDNFDDFYDSHIKKGNIKEASKSSNYTIIEGDIRDKDLLDNIFKNNKIDMVLHLAARAGVRPSIKDPELYYDVNVNGTLYLLETMRKYQVKKMIFASSSSVYGNNEKVPFSEDDNVDFPISPYAASKKAGELICHTYSHLYNFDIFCLRFFTVYGPRQRPEMAIHKFTRNIINGETITLFGDGSSKRDYTYISDIISGIKGAIEHVKGFQIVNLGESGTISLIDLVRLIEKNTEKKADIKFLPSQPGDVDITFADITKARKILSYNPSFPVNEGIKQFINWYIQINQNTTP